jgi:hypothetical protein
LSLTTGFAMRVGAILTADEKPVDGERAGRHRQRWDIEVPAEGSPEFWLTVPDFDVEDGE